MSLCGGSLEGTAWGPRSFFPWLNPHWFLQPELWGLIFLALKPWVGGLGMGLGLLTPEISLPNFYPVAVGPARPCLHPSSQSGWMCFCFFNSVVVRLPFNLISVGSEKWLFYILVVILLLCNEVSHVCPRHHLDWKFTFMFWLLWITLLWIWVYKCLFETLLSILLDVCPDWNCWIIY